MDINASERPAIVGLSDVLMVLDKIYFAAGQATSLTPVMVPG